MKSLREETLPTHFPESETGTSEWKATCYLYNELPECKNRNSFPCCTRTICDFNCVSAMHETEHLYHKPIPQFWRVLKWFIHSIHNSWGFLCLALGIQQWTTTTKIRFYSQGVFILVRKLGLQLYFSKYKCMLGWILQRNVVIANVEADNKGACPSWKASPWELILGWEMMDEGDANLQCLRGGDRRSGSDRGNSTGKEVT